MSIIKDLRRREVQQLSCQSFRDRRKVTRSFIDRLGLLSTLEGHSGCVNCLQWSSDGQILASGSDDLRIVLWKPFLGKKCLEFETKHRGNIFSLKFMPLTDDRLIASGAADSKILLHDTVKQETIQTFTNHVGRVKRLAVAPDCPNLLWSASEDSTIMEKDIRTPVNETTILINLSRVFGPAAEAKCLNINPRRQEQIAVGANDPYVRLFDRRKIKTSVVEFPNPANGSSSLWSRKSVLLSQGAIVRQPFTDCAQYYVPGHLPKKSEEFKRKFRPLATTYVSFSPDGTELLVNLGGEQIYLFDLASPETPILNSYKFQSFLKSTNDHCDKMEGTSNGFVKHSDSSSVASIASHKVFKMPPHVEEIKVQANHEFERKRYSDAISLYNVAIQKCEHPILFGNRATALMNRNWDGDTYAALRDCFRALELDPTHIKSHLRLIRCLIDLKGISEAEAAFERFRERFPDQCGSQAFKSVDKELREAVREEIRLKPGYGPEQEGNKPMSQRNPVLSRDAFMRDENSDSNEFDEMAGMLNASDASSTADLSGDASALELTPPHMKKFEEDAQNKALALDYSSRFCGHCNTSTDIKEASFFGGNGQFIVAGSDDGKFFCWDKSTGNIVRVLKGDESIVNCLQSHPTSCLLATSGIEPVVRIWAPLPEDGRENDHLVTDFEKTLAANQRRMNTDPFEAIFMDMGYRVRGVNDSDQQADSSNDEGGGVQCRTS